jgi:hypothetical protein
VFSGLIPVIVLTSLLRPTVAEGPPDTDGASLAFARYVANVQHAASWSPETIEIDAFLPKLQKRGHLRAIRRLNSAGNADYQVLEIAGDRTVRQQVIERYLTAQMTAAELPAASIAMTPANYRFRYQGAVRAGDTVAYVFQIKPRKKRIGLIRSGRLVKSPSLFVKSIGIIRETVLSGGVAQKLLTHLSVDTRLVGLADLTVTESPLR